MKIGLITTSLLLLLLLSLIGGSRWLLYSRAGSNWAVRTLLSSQQGHIGEINGTLIGTLHLQDLQLGPAADGISCANLQITTQLQNLVPLRLQIDVLDLRGLQVTQKTSDQQNQPPELQWPHLPWWSKFIHIDLNEFQLVDFQIQKQSEESFRSERLQGQIIWDGQRLLISDLLMQLPELTIQGQLEADFGQQTLVLALEVQQRQSETNWQTIAIATDLQATDKLLLAGPVTADVRNNQEPILAITGSIGLSSATIEFQTLKLQRPDNTGSLTASGQLNFSQLPPNLNSHLQFNELDLQPETGQQIKLSGELDFSGDLHNYHGGFNLTNHADPPLNISLTGDYSGDQRQIHLDKLTGRLLNGTFGGQALLSWINGWQIESQLWSRKLNPQLLNEQLKGELNIDLQTQLMSIDGNLNGRLALQLHDSSLHNQPLHGNAELLLKNRQFEMSQLQLQGDGISLHGNGKLNDKIQFTVNIERLEQLFATSQGKLTAGGWFRIEPKGLKAEFHAEMEQLRYQDWQIEKVDFSGKTLADQNNWTIQFDGQNLSGSHLQLELERIHGQLQGSLAKHELQLKINQQGSDLQTDMAGGWADMVWRGHLISLVGVDQRLGHWQARHTVPLLLSSTRLELDNLELTSDDHGELGIHGYFLPSSQTVEATIQWDKLDLAILQTWLKDWDIAAKTSGSVSLTSGTEPHLRGVASLTGTLKKEHLDLNFQQARWQANWGDQGLKSDLKLQLDDGSKLQVQFTSADGMDGHWPLHGTLQFQGQDLPLMRSRPWLPPGLNLSGTLDWQVLAHWQPVQPWQITGTAKITNGQVFRQEEDDLISARLNAAKLSWDWEQQLSAILELQLEDHGTINTELRLPIKANWPVKWDTMQPVSGELHSKLEEQGLLSILLPGRVQQSHGQINLDLSLSGNGEQPLLHGDVQLLNAGAFLPTLGIRLNNINMISTIDTNEIKIKSLLLNSAEGDLSAQGTLNFAQWRPQNYQLQIKGERFQLINLPELQVLVTPELNVSGDMSNIQLRGTLTIPELLISKQKRNSLAENSPDLLVVDDSSPAETGFKLTHDIDIQLVLGDQVLLNSVGIDAKLDGRLRLKSTVRQELAAFGAIHVVKGKYSSYGVSLDITKGNLFFNGGALDQPALDILALRKSGEVEAGVQVTGTPKQPVVQLYSEPTMADTDILSYIVLGRPVGGSNSQSSLLMSAAGALLSQGESAVLQEKLKGRLGLDVLDISAGDGDVSSSIITTGKYLNPDLYISLGYSLFSNSNVFKLRYNLTPDWEVESNIGDESGIDLFYKINSK
ncbi:autotransporter secretion inner membrane protein TamB [Desulfuromusa kysingii]|uniref:Autotransporter secretion inner membrane protein TamB n=1 Tax=Desulfuromusa kysingii TaxID=37625 RepID=A0A1H4DPN6_9BACT|nr:translocation/assembly module TamB domain-containing protein [Desulfuromusa kysingii]SEA74162.1 autotransporter secretion inner membrane protein TamB [Desulfuromusa kysingii]